MAHVGQRRHRLGPRGPGQHGGAHRLGQFSPGQQLGVDRRDLREQLLDLLAVAQVPAHHPGQGRRDVPQPGPGPRSSGRRRHTGRAARRRRSGSRACRIAASARSASPTAPARRPPAARPGRAAATAAAAWTGPPGRSRSRSFALSSQKSMPLPGMTINDPAMRVSQRRARRAPRPTAGQTRAARPGRSMPAAASSGR